MEELGTRERRHQRTRDAILTAARRIIHEKGPDGLSMREIARRIEYSPAGLYEYFGSKEEIIAEVCTEGFHRLTQQLRLTDPALPPLEFLVQQGINYINFARANPDFFLLMFTTAPLQAPEGESAGPNPTATLEEALKMSDAFAALQSGVQRAVAEGALPASPERPVFALAVTLWQTVHGVAMLAITMGRGYPDYPAHIETTLRAMVRGMQRAQA
ncbi:MAG: TetR/AcrR family transcriptional regulator [Caldilineaceae bacterium]